MIRFAAAGTLALAIAACDDPGPDPRLNLENDQDVEEEVPAGPQAVEVVGAREDLSTLASLLEQSNMGPALEGARSMTLFAPTNDAFDAVEESTLTFLTDPANGSSLRQVLGFHLLRTGMTAEELAANLDGGSDETASMTTSNNFTLNARRNEDGEIVLVDGQGNEARLVETDLPVANGTVHIIDAVLLPPQDE